MSIVPALDLRSQQQDPSVPHAPANIEAEQALLGAALYDNAAMERLDERLRAEHFYEPFHGRLFKRIEDLVTRGRLAEPIIIADGFGGDPAFEDLGGVRYLADLVDRAPPAANAPDYSRAIYELAVRRELIRIGGDIAAAAASPSDERSPDQQLEDAEQALYAIAEHTDAKQGFQVFSSALDGAMAMVERAKNAKGEVTGIATGLIDLDRKLGGLHPSDLVILAARPSMGKTALATNIAFYMAKTYQGEIDPSTGREQPARGARVGFYSLEMSEEQLALRILSEVSGISGDKMRRGEIEDHDFYRLRDAQQLIRSIPLHIDATGGISLAKLAARARRLKRTKGLDAIFVDYLQLVTDGTARKGDNRVQEVSKITGGLKALAKELQVPVIALSQLSRQVENREDKKPQLSDLRESGSIEQDADAVMFLYREEYYLGRAEPHENTPEHMAWQDEMERVAGQAEVIIGKQRHGPIGTVKLSFDGALTKFGNLARDPGPMNARLPYGEEER